MKKLVIGIITVSLLVIALTGLYNLWTNHQRAKEAEAALANIEANKPPRYIVEVPPEPSSGSSSSDRAVVSIDEDGRLKLNSQEAGTTSDTSQLRAQLEQYFRERGDRFPGRAVFVKASRKLSYAEVVKVIDAVKGADADPIGLEVADPPSDTVPAIANPGRPISRSKLDSSSCDHPRLSLVLAPIIIP